MNNKTIKPIVYGGIVAAIYTVLTLVFSYFSFGPLQVRLSEALTVLPMLFPGSVAGLSIGCAISNMIGGYGVYDIVFGTLATLLGAIGTYLLRKKPFLAALCPVLCNAVIVGSMLYFIVPNSGLLIVNMVTVGAGEFISCVCLGLPLYRFLKSRKEFQSID